MSNIPNKIKNATKEEWVKNFARFGIISKGIVYCLLGIIAFMASLGTQSKDTDKGGVFEFIIEQPFGKILLAILTVGLLGYVMWRWLQAIKDTENKGNDAKGILKRIGFAWSGLVYLAIAIYSAKLLTKSANNGGSSERFIASKALEYSFGEWIVGIIGIGVIIKGLYQIYKGYSGKFKKDLDQSGVGAKEAEVLDKAGRFGFPARGLVLIVIGYFFLRAAIYSNSSEVKDTEGAFSFISSSFGTIAFAVIAIGLLGYGVFMFFTAKYKHIHTA